VENKNWFCVLITTFGKRHLELRTCILDRNIDPLLNTKTARVSGVWGEVVINVPMRPTRITLGGPMLVLQNFCRRVTRQVRLARTSAGHAVQITWIMNSWLPGQVGQQDSGQR
jgi:hypothetical protein